MNLKPIEPGCLAVVVGAQIESSNGRVVRVIRYIGVSPDIEGENVWDTDTPLPFFIDDPRVIEGYSTEMDGKHLIRIDGESFSDETEHHKHQELENV